MRGDLQEPLAKLTADAANKDPRAEVDRLKADEPELFEALTTAVAVPRLSARAADTTPSACAERSRNANSGRHRPGTASP